MKWSEVVSLNEAFVPACDIKANDNNYWKQFIPHENFYDLLNKTLEMYKNKQKAIWLQGTYGSGKTHATMVIKEIFSQDLDKVKEVLNNFDNVEVLDDLEQGIYPMPIISTDTDITYVGRIRKDIYEPNVLHIFNAADQVRVGAATNAVRIAHKWIKLEENI